MTDRKFPLESYPCPCCNSNLHESKLNENLFECHNKHKFKLQLKANKRFLTVLDGCKEHPSGDICIVDSIWIADIPGLMEIFKKDSDVE